MGYSSNKMSIGQQCWIVINGFDGVDGFTGCWEGEVVGLEPTWKNSGVFAKITDQRILSVPKLKKYYNKEPEGFYLVFKRAKDIDMLVKGLLRLQEEVNQHITDKINLLKCVSSHTKEVASKIDEIERRVKKIVKG
jgi:hypothetical protein